MKLSATWNTLDFDTVEYFRKVGRDEAAYMMMDGATDCQLSAHRIL